MNTAGPAVAELVIDVLGHCRLPSPVARHLGEQAVHFVGSADKAVPAPPRPLRLTACGLGARLTRANFAGD